MEIGNGIRRLGDRAHNFYLITDGDAVTVVDAGCSGEWGTLIEGLDAIGSSIDAVEAMVITHVHSDHFGLAKRARSQGIEVSVHDSDEVRALGRYRGRFSVTTAELPRRPRVLWNMIPLVLAGVMKLDFVDQVATFADGETLDVPGHPTVIHTPGHTEGHTMFHCADRGVLFTGDGLVTMDLLSGSTGPQMLDRRFHLDADQARESVARIEDLNADLLLPGHGEPWEGTPAAALAALGS